VFVGDITVSTQVDNSFTAYANGQQVGEGANWVNTDSFTIPVNTPVLAIQAANAVSKWFSIFDDANNHKVDYK
jgi:hypothetical protein